MRRLVTLLGALGVAGLAWRLLPAEGTVPAWRLRDLALLAAAALLLAALRALPLPILDRDTRAWPVVGRALFVGGMVTALAAGALQAAALPGAPLAPWLPVIWLVGVGVLLAGALLPGPVERYAAPAFRWVRDKQGGFMRQAAGDEGVAQAGVFGWSRGAALLLVLLIVAGTGLRVALALRQGPACAPAECALLADSASLQDTLLLQPLATLFGRLGADALTALRLAQAIVHALLLPALALALAPLATPAGVLLGTTLAAFGASTALAGSGAGPTVEAALLIPVAVAGCVAGLGGRAQPGGSMRAWAIAGLALGLLLRALPALSAAWLLWAAGAAALLLWRHGRATLSRALVLVGALAAGAALARLPLDLLLAPFNAALPWRESLAFAGSLAQSLRTTVGILLPAAALVGAGTLLRGGRRGAFLLAGAGLTVLALLRLGPAALGASDMRPALALLTPFLLLGAACAADQLMRTLLDAWRPSTRAELRPLPLVATALVLLLAVQATALVRALQQPALVVANSSDREALAAAAFVSSLRTSSTESGAAMPLLLAPPALLAHPALRVAAADELARGSLVELGPDAIPFTGEAPGGLVYLLPPADLATLNWLRAAYPAGSTLPLPAGDAAQPESPLSGEVPSSFAGAPIDAQLIAFQVRAAELAASRGLTQSLFAGPDWEESGAAQVTTGVGPLDWIWGVNAPLMPPYSAEWSGSLLLPTTGIYTFTAQANADALVSLQLDRRLVLDTSAGLAQQSDRFAAGAYRIDLRFRSGESPGNVALLWQGPGQDTAEPVPLNALHNPALPLRGLLVTTTSGNTWDGALLDQRIDPLLAPPAAPTDGPVSLIWQGQLGVPRAGEYLIGAVVDDSVLIHVAGQTLAERSGPAPLDAPATLEGSIYLERGWQPFSVRTVHTGDTAPSFTLYWQPPGLGPQPLDASAFVPIIGQLTEDDLTLPALEAADAGLGDDEFALTRDPSIWQLQRRIPPQQLPPLLLERAWTAGEPALCGDAIGQLNAPHGLAIDPTAGRIYVADTGNRRVVSLALDGSDFIVLPIEALQEPVDVAVLPGGDLLVLDTVAPNLVRFTPSTSARSDVPLVEGFYRPRGLDVDEIGQIYIADTGGGRVAVTAADGTVQAAMGGAGTTLGAGQPVDVVATGGAVWAIGAEHGRLWQLGSMGSLTAIQPTDTLLGPHLAHLNEKIILSDPARRLVLLLDGRGRPLGALADEGAFQRPTGVAVTPWPQMPSASLLAVADADGCTVSGWIGVLE